MIKQDILLLGTDPQCKAVESVERRSADIIDNNIPSHDPYIPRAHSMFYNCSSLICNPIQFYSITQVTSPNSKIKSCYRENENFNCEPINYHHFKNIDKILFLGRAIEKKKFYAIDCLVYSNKERVCHKKDDYLQSHANLVDTGTLVRPQEQNVLSQDEFICEESEDKEINCDIDPFVPFNDGLKLKQTIQISGDILLKTGSHVVMLKRKCANSWCGYSGRASSTRRWIHSYEPPGGSIYRCYKAKGQQVCKKLFSKSQLEYAQMNWRRD